MFNPYSIRSEILKAVEDVITEEQNKLDAEVKRIDEQAQKDKFNAKQQSVKNTLAKLRGDN